MFAVLNRTLKSDIQSLGYMYFYDSKGIEILKVAVLELPDKDNKRRISRIPAGEYKVVRRWSSKYKNHFHVLDVEGRSYILIHPGNYYTHTKGCILVGENHKHDINKDGVRDVIKSKITFEKILSIAPEHFKLIITDEPRGL